MKSLVTGSNGFIGSHLVEKLLQMKQEVFCLVRKTSNLQWIKKLPVTFVEGDVTNFNSLLSAVKDIDYIFHIGGIVRARSEAEFYQINHIGTENLLAACLQQHINLKKFIYVSSQAAAGPCLYKKPRHESDPDQPISVYGKSKLKAESAVLNYQHHFPITIIRPPSVYGPRDDDILEIFKYVRLGVKLLSGMREKYISLIHISDLVDGIILASQNDRSNGKVYFISNDEYYSIAEIQSAIAQAMNIKTITIRAPEILIDLLAAMSETIAKIRRRAALLNKDKALEMKQRFWLVDNSRIKNELGFSPKISLQDGIEETLKWYLNEGWL